MGTHAYEGRPLPRPDEELVDQGLAFDLGTLLSRRQVLLGLGLGAAALGLAACTSRTVAAGGEIPDETAGPFPADGSDGLSVLDRSGVVRSDIRTSFGGPTRTAEGVPMRLELTVRDLARGVPFAGAAVYVWQCDRDGLYSLYSDGATDQNYLRGVQVADAQGTVRFTSVVPACYPGRWPHVHLEVFPDRASIADSASAVAVSQVALPQGMCEQVYASPGYERSAGRLREVALDRDLVFAEDSGALQLARATGTVERGYTATLDVGVDPST